MRKVSKKRCYRVTNSQTKRVMSKCASRKNAEKQLRLLRAIQYNKKFVPNTSRKSRKMRGGLVAYGPAKI